MAALATLQKPRPSAKATPSAGGHDRDCGTVTLAAERLQTLSGTDAKLNGSALALWLLRSGLVAGPPCGRDDHAQSRA